MKKQWILGTLGIAALAVILIIIGVSGAWADAPVASATIAVGLVTDAPTVEDMGFNWLSYQGLLRAESELGVTGTVYTSTTSADYGPNLQQCVDDGNDLCISVGFLMADVTLSAAEGNPGMYFAIVDFAWESYPDNLRGMVFAAEEASYLGGTLAGLMTESDVVGDIGGMQIPPVEDFVEGYRNGAQCANPDVTVLITYTGTFDDPDLGAQVAQDMIAQGADVIFAAAGPTGAGAVLTATQSGVWGIGVDTDFYVTVFMSGTVAGSDKLLSSVMKRVDNAVFDTIADVVYGVFTSGTVLYDLAADGVGLAPFHEADPFVPQSVRDELASVEQGIINGTIDVNDPCVLTVTSTADNGPGTLRQALLDAGNGDTITFDPAVFPPGSPATIALTSGLPDISQGSLTIDASDAGVILDGSGIGTTPETVLLDDVSLTLDGGQNLITNGDFTAGLGHWRPWDERPGATRSLNSSDFASSPNSYEWSSVAHAGNSRTVYDTTDTSDPFNDWPYDDGSTVWMPATGGSPAELRFWYRCGGVEAGLRALFPDGHEEWIDGWWFDWEADWTEAVVSLTLPGDAVSVALEFEYHHSESWTRGLSINSNGNTIRGLQIINFPFDGMLVIDANENVIGGDRGLGDGPLGQGNLISANGGHGIQICGESANSQVLGNYIGIDLSGGLPMPNAYSGVALQCSPGPHDNVIGGITSSTRNLISGNAQHGISLSEGAHHNTVIGNYIGTDASGMLTLGNSEDGVLISDGAHDNTIGGDTQGERNVISGNRGGVAIVGAHNNRAVGNYIGPDVTGMNTVPGGDWSGVYIAGGSTGNTVGGIAAGERNVIAGQGSDGVTIRHSGTMNNTIIGNYIGTDATGMGSLANNEDGVDIAYGPQNNAIEHNVIAHNGSSGVRIWGTDTMSNTVQGNWIGLDLDEARQAFPADMAISPDYPNDCTLYVATLTTGVHKSTDCGDTWAEVNNGLTEARLMQVEISPDATDANTVYTLAENGYLFVTTNGGANWSLVSTILEGIDRRNLVLSADFTNDQTMYASAEWWSWWELGDGPGVFKAEDGGVNWTRMVNGMSDDHVWKVIASPDPLEKETLFALTHSGIEKSTDGGENWSAVPSPDSDLNDLALSPTYASDQTVFVTANTGRVYSSTDGGRSWSGVDALRGDPRHLALSPDYLNDQTVCHGGGWNDWIYCSTDGGATWTQTDTRLPGWLNDAGTGILFSPDYPTDPTMFIISVAGMAESTDGGATWELVRGLRDLGNTTGVSIGGGASHNTIGLDNVISNNYRGVTIGDDDTAYNVVVGNLIGTDPTGTFAQSNNEPGVTFWGGHHNRIGGGTAEERNVISGNGDQGVGMWGTNTFSNTVRGNYIGTDSSGTVALGNRYDGVHINGPSHTQVIDNLISGNDGGGVSLCCTSDTSHNTVSGNYIGTDASGTVAIPNDDNGVSISDGANYNLIGGDTAGERNVISGNGWNGVSIRSSGTTSNTVSGNYIGVDASGANALPNQAEGINIHNWASYNLIGGPTAGERNVISANGAGCGWCDGIFIGDDAHHNTVQGNYIGTDATGTSALGNRSQGIDLYNRASDNVIRDNLIAASGENGIAIWNDSPRNVVEGNLIGTDASGTQPLGNGLRSSAKEETLAESASRLESRLPLPAPSAPRENYPPDWEPNFHAPERWPEMQPKSISMLGSVSDRDPTFNLLARTSASSVEPSENGQSQGEAESSAEAGIEVTLTNSSNAGDGVYIGSGASLNTVGVNNTIAFNGGHGVRVEGGDTLNNTITRNSIFGNDGAGIALSDGGNGGLATPRLTEVNLASGVVIGTACAGCTVEIYSADDEEGRIFEGETTADGAGDFAFNKEAALAGPNVTATATDADGNTSPFSPLFEILWVNLGVDDARWALERLGLVYTEVDGAGFASVNLNDYDVLFVGSARWAPSDDYLQPLVDRKADISAYVAAGGGLVVLGHTDEWGGGTPLDWTWVPVTVSVGSDTGRKRLIAPEHLVAQGLNDNNFHDWWVNGAKYFTAWDWPEATSVAQGGFDSDSQLLVGPYGVGRLVLCGSFPDASDSGDPLLRNLLTWAGGALTDVPPQLTEAYPADGALSATQTGLRLTFSEIISPTTVTDASLTVVGSSNGAVTGQFITFDNLNVIRFQPDAPFQVGETVTVILRATVEDMTGNGLDGDGDGLAEGSPDDDVTWTFTVRAGETLSVTSPADEGDNTLRQALQDALPGDTITFDPTIFPPGDPVTIYPGETMGYGLPTLDVGYVTLDASNAGVVIDPEYRDVGLRIQSDGNVVRGLTIIHGDWTGLDIRDGASFNLIGGNRTLGDGPSGQGNTIGLCQDRNVQVRDTGTISNTFLGNYIGTDPTGTQAWPSLLENWGAGLVIDEGAAYTTIGSTVPGERNLFSGNEADGLELNGCDYSLVIGNYLGTDASGLGALPNGDCGVDMQDGARYNRLEDNVFSGNWCGVQTDDPGTGYNEFIGNYFGADATGTAPLPNGSGLLIFDNVQHTLIEGNIFAGGDGDGIMVRGMNNVVRGNWIGTDPTETANWGYQGAGIFVDGFFSADWGGEDSYDNLIEENVIANNGQGIIVREWGGARVDGNTLRQNRIYNSFGSPWWGPNLDDGIALLGNANVNLLPPIVTSFNTAIGDASGTACAGCTVEVFSDDDDEGRWYEGSTTADGAGNWSFSKGSAFTGANVHATATDAAGNTSEFSGPSPIVSSVSPTSTVPGTSDLGVTISGDYFRDNEPLTVDFGAGVTVTSIRFISSTEIEVYLDVDPGAAFGLRDVTVTNYDGQSGTLSDGFKIVSVPPPPPTVTAVNPDEVAPDVSGNLTIHGAGFIDRPDVAISGDGVTVNWLSFDDATRLTVNVSVDPTATLGPRDVTVTNPDGQSDTLVGGLTVVSPHFEEVGTAAGVDESGGTRGVAWGDYDNDGDDDLYTASSDGSHLYRNEGDGTFTDVPEAGVNVGAGCPGTAWADYDNDGYLDLLLIGDWNDDDHYLFRNNGDGTFTDVTTVMGFVFPGDPEGAAWADYDRDGDVDLFVGVIDEPSVLFRNDGNTFTEVGGAAGVAASMRGGSGVAWGDYDSDGWPDLFVVTGDYALYHNNGDGTFTELSAAAGISGDADGSPSWGDYDNDGDLDLFVTNWDWDGPDALFRNNGDGTFTEVAAAAGVDLTYYARSAAWGDYDNDGWLDLYVGDRYYADKLYHNEGNGTFSDGSLAARLDEGWYASGAAWGDYDGNGHLDLYVGIEYGTNLLYHNLLASQGSHWLHVKTVGTVSNRSGIGGRVRVVGGGLSQIREVSGGSGFYSQDSLPVEFGFGTYDGTVTVEVTWPSGLVDTLTGVAVDQVITVTESGVTISEVKVTNVRDTSLTVSWITNIPSDGHVNYGTDPDALDQTAYDDRGTGTSDDTHYVTLEGLLPNTTYYFDVVSGATTDDNDGAHYSITTGPTLGLPGSDTIWGQVFKEDGTTLAEGTIVYITLQDADGSGSPDEAAPLSALVDDTGYWNANLGNARVADLSAYFTYSASGDQVKLEAQGAADGTGCLLVDTANDSPAVGLILNVSTCLIEREIPLQVGWNHISLPLDPLTSYTAEGVCDEIISQGGDVAEIDRWYASGWDGHICGLPFNDFAIELGSDYFIKSSAVSTWTIEGYPVTTAVPLDLQVGWNSIGIPHTEAYTAESLCEEINDQCGDGTAVEVDRWYASGWDGHICGLPFNDFAIEIGKGYFVKASGGCTVTPSLAALSIGRWRMENGERTMDDSPPSVLPLPPSLFHREAAIAEVKATNVRDTSFTVSWSTDVIATGWVNYGTSPALGQTAYDDRGAKAIGQSHHVTLQGLSPQTTYYFEVVSGATVDDHEGSGYQVTTGPTLGVPASDSIYGQVFESDGVTPAEGAIVYITLRDADGAGSSGEAAVMSALVGGDGWWQANLGNARLADGTGYFTYSATGEAVVLMAQGAGGGFVSQTVDTGDLGPAAPLTLVRQRRPYLPLVVEE